MAFCELCHGGRIHQPGCPHDDNEPQPECRQHPGIPAEPATCPSCTLERMWVAEKDLSGYTHEPQTELFGAFQVWLEEYASGSVEDSMALFDRLHHHEELPRLFAEYLAESVPLKFREVRAIRVCAECGFFLGEDSWRGSDAAPYVGPTERTVGLCGICSPDRGGD